jgi:peptidyl-prolyl cis-trans isomerase D
VGPYKVSAAEYQQSYQNLLNFYRMIYREQLDDKLLGELKLKEQAMVAVERYLLVLKAHELNLSVSDREFSEYLASMDAFKRDGKFSESVYAEVLKRNGIDPKVFEERERQNLLAGQMLHILEDNGVLFSERDVREGYTRERGQVRLGYAVFDPADYRDQVRIDVKEIEETYEKEKSLHRTEPVYKLQYIVVDEKSPVRDDQAYMELIKEKDLAAYAKSKV